MNRTSTAAIALLLAASAPVNAPTWAVAPQPPVPKHATDSILRSVTVLSPGDVWVVGAWFDSAAHTLAVHWNGSQWTTVPTPDAAVADSEYGLNAVDAVGPHDVWAVGDILTEDAETKKNPLLAHYDGVEWTEQRAPDGVTGELTAVDLLPSGDGWAVGGDGVQPVILRRSAGQWSSVPVPAVGVPGSLASVYAVSPTDAWAVGTQQRNGRTAGLVLHWDGLLWRPMTLPDAGTLDETLTDVAAVSASDVWAVGTLCASVCQSRVLHLSAGTWQPVPSSPAATLTSVIAFSPADVWIFGQSTSAGQALDHIEHWNGTAFSVDVGVPPATADPHHPASALALAAAAADPQSGTMWTVGWVQIVGGKQPHALYR